MYFYAGVTTNNKNKMKFIIKGPGIKALFNFNFIEFRNVKRVFFGLWYGYIRV